MGTSRTKKVFECGRGGVLRRVVVAGKQGYAAGMNTFAGKGLFQSFFHGIVGSLAPVGRGKGIQPGSHDVGQNGATPGMGLSFLFQ